MNEFAKRFLYSLKKYPKIKKTRIFIIGFNKTATRTIHYFFKSNGLESVHWDNTYLVEHFEYNLKKDLPLIGAKSVHNTKTNSNCLYRDLIAFSDITHDALGKDAKDYYKILDKQNPGSKFILNFRDVDSWVKSRSKHCNGRLLKEHLTLYNCSSFEELKETWIKIFNSHFEDCEKYFKNKEKDFLIFNINRDGPEKICKFLKDCYPNLNPKKWEYKGKTRNK